GVSGNDPTPSPPDPPSPFPPGEGGEEPTPPSLPGKGGGGSGGGRKYPRSGNSHGAIVRLARSARGDGGGLSGECSGPSSRSVVGRVNNSGTVVSRLPITDSRLPTGSSPCGTV